jgi:hypothetical protein
LEGIPLAKPKAPTPPDPTKTAQAQTDQSLTTSIANNAMGMVGQRGPDGSLTYNQTGTRTINIGGKEYQVPTYEAVTQLSDAAQKRFDTTNRVQQNLADVGETLSGQIMDTTGRPISYDGLPELAGSGGYGEQRKAVEDAMLARMQPAMEKRRQDMERNLSNRGIKLGNEQWNQGFDEVNRAENDARLAAVMAGGQEQSRLAGLDSATRAQLLQERNNQANEPINRLAALLSQTQVNTPQYQTYTPQGMATTDVAGLAQQGYANQMQAYQQKMAQQNALYGGLFGLGSAAITGGMLGKGFGG